MRLCEMTAMTNVLAEPGKALASHQVRLFFSGRCRDADGTGDRRMATDVCPFLLAAV